jgi:ATP synthase protein I
VASQKPGNDDNTPNLAQQLGLALSIPTLLAAGPLVGFGLAWLIRRWTGWGEWVTWLMVILGIIAGIREVVSVIRRLS